MKAMEKKLKEQKEKKEAFDIPKKVETKNPLPVE